MSAAKKIHVVNREPILVIDDELFFRKLLNRILGGSYEVFEASSAEEGVEVLRKHPVKVIVCDHYLPGENGLDFLMRLKKRNPKVKAILVSAALETADFIKAINEGLLFRYIPKPMSARNVRAAVEEAFRLVEMEHLMEQKSLEEAQFNQRLKHMPYWIRRLESMTSSILRSSGTILGTMLTIVLIVAMVALGVGILVILILYFNKTITGVDAMEGFHLRDVMPGD
jgi:DNA-binding NtrC family response regulator